MQSEIVATPAVVETSSPLKRGANSEESLDIKQSKVKYHLFIITLYIRVTMIF